MIGPRVIELTIATPAFAEPTMSTSILPAGYDDDPDRRWPVTYVTRRDDEHLQDLQRRSSTASG